MAWREVIVSLNTLGVGDLSSIQQKIEVAQEQILQGGQPELADRLREAASALAEGRFSEYRRLLSLVVSRLGHLRD